MLRPHGSGVGLLCSGAVLLSILGGSGCTAIIARSKIAGAESALNEAEKAGAKTKAQYRYTLALLYLEKAREEEAFARLGVATELGGKAEKYAVDAHQEANGELAPVAIVPLTPPQAQTTEGAAAAPAATPASTTAPAAAVVAPAPGPATPAPAPAAPAPAAAPAANPAVPPLPPELLFPEPAPLPPADPNAPLPPIPFPDDLPPTPPPPSGS